MKVAIAGLGLIGGSIARGLSAAGHHVVGCDDPAVLRRARRAGAIAASASLEDAARACEVVFLAAPPKANLRLLRSLAAAGLSTIVTDVGSVKQPICSEARRLRVTAFTGGHPMAGSAGSGFGASSTEMFQGRTWALTPAPRRRPPRALLALIRTLGARPIVTTPAAHDRAVAFVSHVPQIVAWALADAALGDPVARRLRTLAGPAYREMTRIAASPQALWREILGENRGEVRRALAALRGAIARRAPR